MVKVVKCVLIKTEPSIKEVISYLSESSSFLIHEVDDYHIFITEEGAKNIELKVKEIMK